MSCRENSVRGFTLVEVLIALSLLALLMLVLTGAMRSMGQTEERIDQKVSASDDYRTMVNFLHDVLGRVSARRIRSSTVGAPSEVPFFDARPDSLAWVGVMPARVGVGGRHYMRLAVERGPSGRQLVLRFSPWTGAPSFNAWSQANAQVLAASVDGIALRYQDPGSGQWGPAWPPPGVPTQNLPPSLLPSAIELQFAGQDSGWPPLVVGVVPSRASDPSALGASFGGSVR